MENIRRNIRLFFVTYGELLFIIIGISAIVLFSLRGINYLYKENTQVKEENTLTQIEIQEKEELNKEKEDKLFISEFLEYCNDKKVEKAYSMLSEECIKENYPTIEKFEDEYVNKIFTYKKEYEITREDDIYKVTILEGILESGSLKNRKYITNYYRIQEVIGKTIYIEGNKIVNEE